MNKEIISLDQQNNKVVIKLANNDNKVVFMQHPTTCNDNCKFIFIEVNTLKKYWARNHYDEFSKYAYASEHELRQDYKFHYAEDGFSHGENNPVPVAQITLLDDVPPCITFQNGITRTIWLIANGYKIIPFEVEDATYNFLSDEGIYLEANIDQKLK